MLTNYPGICRNLYLPDYTLFDLETTGVSCRSDDVVEISALRVRGGAVVNSFSSLVNPGRHIPSAASQVNHITDEMVAGAPTMEEVLPEFLAFIGEDVLVGHTGLQVLVERTAQRSHNCLEAATDAQHRYTAVVGQAYQHEFHEVALGVDAVELGDRLFAEEEGIDVGPARDDQTVNMIEDAGQ